MTLTPLSKWPSAPVKGDLELTLTRGKFSDKSTQGVISCVGLNLAWSLERPWRGGDNLHDNKATPENESSCILPGRYELVAHVWSLTGKVVPMLVGVQGRDGILIHPANYPYQLLGCIAPGLSISDDTVLSSRDAMTGLMNLINPVWKRKGQVWLNVGQAPSVHKSSSV
jgi:hypothetical protein